MEPVRDYELKAFFSSVVAVLEQLGLSYMVVGGFAAVFYGEPRLTIDIDIIVDIHLQDVARFSVAFSSPDYYVSEEGIRDSVRRRYPFNVIEPGTGAKADLVPLPNDPFTRSAFRRRQRLAYDEAGHAAFFIAPEDILVAKLIAYRESGSEKHLRDAQGVLLMQQETLDLEEVGRRARTGGVEESWELLLQALRPGTEP